MVHSVECCVSSGGGAMGAEVSLWVLADVFRLVSIHRKGRWSAWLSLLLQSFHWLNSDGNLKLQIVIQLLQFRPQNVSLSPLSFFNFSSPLPLSPCSIFSLPLSCFCLSFHSFLWWPHLIFMSCRFLFSLFKMSFVFFLFLFSFLFLIYVQYLLLLYFTFSSLLSFVSSLFFFQFFSLHFVFLSFPC